MSDFRISYAPYAADDGSFLSQQMQIATVRLRGRALTSLPSDVSSGIFDRYKQRIRRFIDANQQQYRLSNRGFAHQRTTFIDPGLSLGLAGPAPRSFPPTEVDLQYINNNGQPVVHMSMPAADAFLQRLEEEAGGLPEEASIVATVEEAQEFVPAEVTTEEEFVEPETPETEEVVLETPDQPEIEEPEIEEPEITPDEPVIEEVKDAPWGTGEVLSFLVIGATTPESSYSFLPDASFEQGYVELVGASDESDPVVIEPIANVTGGTDYLQVLCFYDFPDDPDDPDAPTPASVKEAFLEAPFIREIYEKDRMRSSDRPDTVRALDFPSLEEWVGKIQFYPAEYGARLAGRAAGYINLYDEVNTYAAVGVDSVPVYELPIKIKPLTRITVTNRGGTPQLVSRTYLGFTNYEGVPVYMYRSRFSEIDAYTETTWDQEQVFSVTSHIADPAQGVIASTKTDRFDGRAFYRESYYTYYREYTEYIALDGTTVYLEYLNDYRDPRFRAAVDTGTMTEYPAYAFYPPEYFPEYHLYYGQYTAAPVAGPSLAALYGYAYPGATDPYDVEVLARAIFAEGIPPVLDKVTGDIDYSVYGDSERRLRTTASLVTAGAHQLSIVTEPQKYTHAAIPVGYASAPDSDGKPVLGDVIKVPLRAEYKLDAANLDYRDYVFWTE